ncbi:MAG: sensor histidine kinase, partial [Oscillospiraceae bacterium]|nr:sensor histidine kinase [Oscillospiraceae bacterium]
MNRQERKQRLSLTLFFAAVVFLSMFVTILLAGILVYLATHFGVISLDGEISTSQSIMLMMLLSILIGAALTMAVIRIPLNPFYSIISGMRKLAQGDYKARLNMGHLFSMRSLGGEVVETFNTLAAELESTEMLRSDFIN